MTVHWYDSVTCDNERTTRNKLRSYKLFCYPLFAPYHLSLSSTLSFVLFISISPCFYFQQRYCFSSSDLFLLHYISFLPSFLLTFLPSIFLLLSFSSSLLQQNFPAFSSFLSKTFLLFRRFRKIVKSDH